MDINSDKQYEENQPNKLFNNLLYRAEKLFQGKFEFVYLIYFVILVKIIFLLLVSYKMQYSPNTWDVDEDKKFRVERGFNLYQIADKLESDGIIDNAFLFKLLARFTGKGDLVYSRTYIFKNGVTNLEILSMLTSPDLTFNVKFTVPEGMRIRQISRQAENLLGISEIDFIRATENDSLIRLIDSTSNIKNLEGFLFPETYFVPVDVSASELVKIMFDEFRNRVIKDTAIYEKLLKGKLGFVKSLILASIVQGETIIKDEMPVIAGVYLNRLKKGMKLEADPTIQYALPGGPKPRLLKEDLKIDSPYNTYKYSGLPPGPINNPGLDAIKSVIYPENHDYLFFVATGKGGHKFSATYQEHLRAADEYRKQFKNQN